MKKRQKNYIPGTIVPRPFLLPLGYLTIWAARMEAIMDETILKFFAVDDVNKGLAVTARFSTLGNKLDFLQVLADLAVKNSKAKSALSKICADGQKFVSERNKLIHGRWIASDDRHAMKISYKAQGKLTHSTVWFSPAAIKTTAELGLDVSDRFAAFFVKYPNWAEPLISTKTPTGKRKA